MLFLQIINSIVGSGLLGLPSVFDKMGILLGQFIMTCVFIIMCIAGLLLLLRLPDREEDRLESLTKHMKASLKRRWMQITASGIVLLGIFLQEFGALVSYIFIIMSDFKHLNPIAVSCFLFIILLWLTIIDITKISGFSILAMVIFMIYKMSFIAMRNRLTCNETMLEDKISL